MKTLKRVLLLVAASLLVCGCSVLKEMFVYYGDDGDIYYSQYYDGYWGEWNRMKAYKPQFLGQPDDFGIGWMGESPRSYYAKIKVNRLITASLKKNKYSDFSGTIEYSAERNVSKTNFNEQSRGFVNHFETFDTPLSNETIVRPAKISICKSKKGRIVYNLFFDNVGIALSIPWRE